MHLLKLLLVGSLGLVGALLQAKPAKDWQSANKPKLCNLDFYGKVDLFEKVGLEKLPQGSKIYFSEAHGFRFKFDEKFSVRKNGGYVCRAWRKDDKGAAELVSPKTMTNIRKQNVEGALGFEWILEFGEDFKLTCYNPNLNSIKIVDFYSFAANSFFDSIGVPCDFIEVKKVDQLKPKHQPKKIEEGSTAT